MLRANDGKMINTVANKSFIIVSKRAESGSSDPEAVNMTRIPKKPNAIDA